MRIDVVERGCPSCGSRPTKLSNNSNLIDSGWDTETRSSDAFVHFPRWGAKSRGAMVGAAEVTVLRYPNKGLPK